ncbi:unnamed protein product [Protopolystoma xenopodis]|uniref:Uncharacterized protein n=1 Tax=Protopolystoma xenopodis TaxID=117903 RepID=A0A448XBH0_9PLAT|nr:unnamed protein product [Protopolystoma xenopodis]
MGLLLNSILSILLSYPFSLVPVTYKHGGRLLPNVERYGLRVSRLDLGSSQLTGVSWSNRQGSKYLQHRRRQPRDVKPLPVGQEGNSYSSAESDPDEDNSKITFSELTSKRREEHMGNASLGGFRSLFQHIWTP